MAAMEYDRKGSFKEPSKGLREQIEKTKAQFEPVWQELRPLLIGQLGVLQTDYIVKAIVELAFVEGLKQGTKDAAQTLSERLITHGNT